MKVLKAPFWLMYKAHVGFVFYFTLLLLYPVFKYYLKNEDTWDKVFIWLRRWGRLIRILTFINLRVTGRENFPSPPYVVVSNHTSYIDTVLMYSIIPDYFVFLGKSELRYWPLFRIFFRSGMNIAVERNSVRGATQAAREAVKKLDKGESVAIYPEGGILHDVPELSRFKNGAFKIAMETDVPIVPVVLFNTYKIMESNYSISSARPGVARAKVLPPVSTKEYTDKDLVTLRKDVRNRIKKELDRYEGK